MLRDRPSYTASSTGWRSTSGRMGQCQGTRRLTSRQRTRCLTGCCLTRRRADTACPRRPDLLLAAGSANAAAESRQPPGCPWTAGEQRREWAVTGAEAAVKDSRRAEAAAASTTEGEQRRPQARRRLRRAQPPVLSALQASRCDRLLLLSFPVAVSFFPDEKKEPKVYVVEQTRFV